MKLVLIQPVNLRGQHEIVFGEAVDPVSKNRDLYLAPGKQEIGMVALVFRHRASAVDEVEGVLKIRETEHTEQVVTVGHVPFREL